jgi:hypothetical protein
MLIYSRENINGIMKRTDTLIGAINDIGREGNTGKTK